MITEYKSVDLHNSVEDLIYCFVKDLVLAIVHIHGILLLNYTNSSCQEYYKSQ